MNRVLAGTLSEFPEGAQKSIEFYDEYVLVLRSPSGFWAIEDRCSHDDNELFGGPVVGKSIKCVRHGATFDLETGAALSMPAVRGVKSYRVVVEDDQVWVETNN